MVRTRLNIPDAIDLHRFFAPECDFNLGNCATADVENSRVVASTRGKKNMLASPMRRGRMVDSSRVRVAEKVKIWALRIHRLSDSLHSPLPIVLIPRLLSPTTLQPWLRTHRTTRREYA